MTDAARPLGDESDSGAMVDLDGETDERLAARLAVRREKLLEGAKPLQSMDDLRISGLTKEESDAFGAAISRNGE